MKKFIKKLKKFEHIKYDGWSIYWFFKLRFLENKLPKIFYKSEKFLEYSEKIKCWLGTHILSKYPAIPKNNKKRIMFLAHTNAIIPDKKFGFTIDRIKSLIEEIRKDSELEEYISIVSPFSHKNYLEILNCDDLIYPYMVKDLIYPYVDKEIKEKAKRNSILLHKQWEDLKIKNKNLTFFFSKEVLYLIILYYEIYKKIIKEKQIDLLCLYADIGILSKCAIAAGHKSGIKILHIWHGTEIPTVNPDQPDSVYHATIGKKYKEEYIKLGVNPDNIFITGAVFMDEIVPYVNKKYPEHKEKRILLATSSWIEDNRGDEETYINYMKKFLSEIEKLDAELVIKLHPREKSDKLYRNIISKNVKILKNNGKYDLIGNSDVIISFGSTINTEAMIMGKPTMFIDFEQFPLKDFILRDERVLRILPKENVLIISENYSIYVIKLRYIIKKILYHEDFRKEIIEKQNEIVSEYLYKIDGNAGKRTMEVIKKLLSTSQ